MWALFFNIFKEVKKRKKKQNELPYIVQNVKRSGSQMPLVVRDVA